MAYIRLTDKAKSKLIGLCEEFDRSESDIVDTLLMHVSGLAIKYLELERSVAREVKLSRK